MINKGVISFQHISFQGTHKKYFSGYMYNSDSSQSFVFILGPIRQQSFSQQLQECTLRINLDPCSLIVIFSINPPNKMGYMISSLGPTASWKIRKKRRHLKYYFAQIKSYQFSVKRQQVLQNELDFVKFISEWVASLYKCTDPQPFFWKRNEITLKHIVDMMQTVTIAKRQNTTRTNAVQSPIQFMFR